LNGNNTTLRVFVGWDSREDIAYQACKQSLLTAAKYPNNLEVYPLKLDELRKKGFYTREEDKLGSTEFTFSRFLVPELCNYEGWALFIDCDFIFREDVRNLFDKCDDRYAIMCVQHDYQPKDGKEKMDGKVQHNYPRKNWSSCVLWNCSHPANKAVTKELVNNPETTGKYLHRFSWLDDSQIGRIHHEWNWLVGWYREPEDGSPKAIHYTEGGPWFKKYSTCEYSGDWYKAEKAYIKNKDENAKHKLTPDTWKVNDEKKEILESVLNYLVDPQAKYYEGNTWDTITRKVQDHMGKIVAIDTSETNFERKGHKYDPILENFVMGCNGSIASYDDHRDTDTSLVIRGVGGGSRKAIAKCWDINRTFYTVDTGYFGNFKNKWLHRVTKNALQQLGPIIERPMDRAKAHGYRYRKFIPGTKILICPPSEKVMRLFGQPDPQAWVDQTIAEIKKHTDRPIEVRLKPLRSERITTKTIQAALQDDVHCLVTYNSIAAVEALMEGKPALVLGQNAASTVCETEIANIEHPKQPPRDEIEAFFAHLGYCQFSVHELRSGYAWRIVNETASGKLPLWNSGSK
tara:strand:+ start:2657 stop:4375 length:1719 start_codon:yes stop_codon:yes gene_type:complete